MVKVVLRYFIVFLSLNFLASCVGAGYTFKGGIIPGKTFSMNAFPNNASIINPSLSYLTVDALRQKILSESSLKYSEFDGDAHFEGTITGYAIMPIQATGNQISAQSRLTISIQVVYTNLANDKINYNKTFTDFDDFDNSVDFVSVETQLVEKILKKLVDQIYNAAMEDW
jgi:hypothetical protein